MTAFPYKPVLTKKLLLPFSFNWRLSDGCGLALDTCQDVIRFSHLTFKGVAPWFGKAIIFLIVNHSHNTLGILI